MKVEIDDGNVPKYDLHFLPREDHDEVDYKVVKEQAERLQILMNGIKQVVQKCEDDKKKAQLKKKQLKDFETFFDSQH